MTAVVWCNPSAGLRCLRVGVLVLVFSIAGCSASSPAPPAGAVPPAVVVPPGSVSAPPSASMHDRSHIRGQIVAEQGSTWTVRDDDGRVYTVKITRRTDFGTLFNLRARDQFKVGHFVRIAGIFAGTSGTANAVDFSDPEPADPANGAPSPRSR